MEEVDPETALAAVESERERRRERAVDALDWFRGREGLVARSEAVSALAAAHGWSEAQSNRAIADVVGDLVDPVQQVVHPARGKLVGIIEYHEHPDAGCYAYIDYDDVDGRRRRSVCSRCVERADSDTEVAHATAGEGTVPPDATWTDLYNTIEAHYEAAHDVEPSEVTVGASLVSGTTISGSTAFHAGNDGPGSNLDADTVDGNQASDLGASLALTNPSQKTASRSLGTRETNGTGNILRVYVVVSYEVSDGEEMELIGEVNGDLVDRTSFFTGGFDSFSLLTANLLVPDGSSYQVQAGGDGTPELDEWYEQELSAQ